MNLFRNATFEPRLSEPVGTAVRRAIQRDGSFRLATRDGGDIVVDGVIKEFRRSAISFQPADIVTVRDYELILVADVTAVDQRSGEVLVQTEVGGRTVIRAGADLASAERQAVPLLANDLARNLTSLLVDGRW